MKIRKANVKDIPRMIDLTMQLRKVENIFSKKISYDKKSKQFFENVFKKYIYNKDWIFLVAEEKQILGLIYGFKEKIHPFYKNQDVGYIADIIIDEKERGKGIGKELVKAIENKFKKIGLKEMKLMVLKDNKKSYNFWKENCYSDLYVEMRKDL